MTTEILGFIIILGGIIVFLARKQIQKAEDDPEVLEASTGRLRYELEQSADEIINRMTDHIDRLERLLREADYKAELLQQKLDACQMASLNQPVQTDYKHNMAVNSNVSQNTPQAAAPKAAQPDYNGADANQQQPAQDFQRILNAEMDASSLDRIPGERVEIGQSDRQPQGLAPEALLANSGDAYYVEHSSESAQPADSGLQLSKSQMKALQYIREASMELEAHQSELLSEDNAATVNPPPAYSSEGVASCEQLQTDETVRNPGSNEQQIEQATQKARELIAMGYTPEQAAKETGLGQGAVELIWQLYNRHTK